MPLPQPTYSIWEILTSGKSSRPLEREAQSDVILFTLLRDFNGMDSREGVWQLLVKAQEDWRLKNVGYKQTWNLIASSKEMTFLREHTHTHF